MKKILTLLVVALSTAFAANAQIGIIGGFTSSNTSLSAKDLMTNAKNMSLYHVGVAYRLELIDLLVIQPEITYQTKGAKLTDAALKTVDFTSKSGYVEGAVGIQLGIDLLAFRPFLLAQPFVGYQVTGSEKFGSETIASLQNAKNKLEYGIGLGGGIELLNHLQISVQWYTNLGKLYQNDKVDAVSIGTAIASTAFKDVKNYQGVKITLGLFF